MRISRKDFNRIASDSELISYEVVKDSFQSNETVESTEDKKEYQTKVIINLNNMAKYDLEYFDVTVEFVEEGTNQIWTYTQEDFNLYK